MEDAINVLTTNKDLEIVMGFPVSETGKVMSENEIIKKTNGSHALIGMARERITRRVIESNPKLKVICKYGIGVDNIDVRAASEHGVLVVNAPVHSSTVAESAITLMLSLLKKVPQNAFHLKNGNWRDISTLGRDLSGKTLGIVGFGSIGKKIAKKLQNWNVDCLVYDPFIADEDVNQYNIQKVNKQTLLTSSDIISLHLPLSDDTKDFINYKELSRMKKSAILINTAREKIVNEESLIHALKKKLIAGAGIDVFYNEPITSQHPLLHMDNVIALPHVSGYTFEALYQIALQTSYNCIDALNDKVTYYTVNKEEITSI